MPYVIFVLLTLIVPTFAKINMNNPNVLTRATTGRIWDVVSAKVSSNYTILVLEVRVFAYSYMWRFCFFVALL